MLARLPGSPADVARAVRRRARRRRRRRRAGAVALAAPALLRLLPANTSLPVDPRRAAVGRARRAGDELGHVAGVHRAGDCACVDWMAELLDLPDRVPQRPRQRGSRGGRHPGLGERGHARRDPRRALAGDRRAPSTATATRRGSSPTPRPRPTRASRRGCGSPASAPTAMRVVAHDERVRHATRRPRRGDRRRPRRRTGAVLRVRHPRHDVVDGVRPDADIAAVSAGAGAWLHVDAAMSGIAALVPEQRWVNDGARARRQLLHQPAQVDGHQLRLRPVLDRRPRVAARRAEHPARVPALRRRPGTARRRTCRDWQVPLGRRFRALKLWFGVAPRRRRAVPGDDPRARRPSPRSWPRWSPPTTASRSSPRTRSTWCASGSSTTTTPPRR